MIIILISGTTVRPQSVDNYFKKTGNLSKVHLNAPTIKTGCIISDFQSSHFIIYVALDTVGYDVYHWDDVILV